MGGAVPGAWVMACVWGKWCVLGGLSTVLVIKSDCSSCEWGWHLGWGLSGEGPALYMGCKHLPLSFQAMRTLNWKYHLGLVNLDVELADRTLSLSVTPVHAAIILHFQTKSEWDHAAQLDVALACWLFLVLGMTSCLHHFWYTAIQ